MRARILTLLIGAALGAAAVVAVRPPAAVPASEAEAALDRPLPEPIDWYRLPFAEAVAGLERLSGARIVVDWPALEAAGLPADQPVGLRCGRTTLDGALRSMEFQRPPPPPFKPWPPPSPGSRLLLVADGNVIRLTTQDRAKERRVVR